MLKRLSIVILFAGLLLGAAPGAASAHEGGRDRRDDHYRCMYRCRGDYYYRRGDRDRDPKYCWYRDRYGWYRARCYRNDRRDDYGGGYYTYHRQHEAAQADTVTPFHAGHDHGPAPKPDRPKEHGHGHGHGHGDDDHGRRGEHHESHHEDDSAHAGGGYDAHRSHDRD